MKTRLIFLIFICLFFTKNSSAQNNKKWAVGPDLLGLFNINTIPKYSLYARFKLGDKSALRVRPSYYDVAMKPGIFDVLQQKTYAVRAGYERAKSLHKESLYLLYGVEYIFYNDHRYFFDYYNPSNAQSPLITDHVEKGIGFFIGARYFLLPGLSIATESTLQITRTRIIKDRVGLDEYSYDFVSTLLIPITSFNLCFHF